MWNLNPFQSSIVFLIQVYAATCTTHVAMNMLEVIER